MAVAPPTKSDAANAAQGKAAASGQRQRLKKPGRGGESRSDGRFVAYLPQDDAAAAGCGEREGGIQVSASQDVTDLLNTELSALLRLRPQQFWRQVVNDGSLHKYLGSYLRFRRRWYDFIPCHNGEGPASMIVGDNDLHLRTFKVLLRMSSCHEKQIPPEDSAQSREYARILFDKGLLDVPKLMNICAIYGHENPDLTHGLVNNVLKSIPNVADEISAIVPPLVHTLDIMHRRCCNTIKELTEASSPAAAAAEDYSNIHQQLVEVLDYLNDVVATIAAFIDAYPPAAPILATFAAPSHVQGPFLPFLAGIHDSLLPIIRKGFAAVSLDSSNQAASSSSQEYGSKRWNDHRFKRLQINLVSLTWQILRITYLLKQGVGSASSQARDENERHRVHRLVQGDLLVQAVAAIAMGVDDRENFSFGTAGGLLKLNCTGAMLRRIERRFGLCGFVRQLCHDGDIILDDAQYEHIAAMAADDESNLSRHSREITDVAKLSSGEDEKGSDDEAASVLTKSRVQQVRDLFPAFGTGFILACLEVYDNDPEKVIQNVLEGSLYPDLASLETWLEKKPTRPMAGVSGKDKGKKILGDERPTVVHKLPLALESSSSSQLRPDSGAGPSQPQPVSPHLVLQPGQQHVEPSSHERTADNAVDTRLESVRDLAEAFAAEQLEYDDEYDDSYDDLGTYPADAGLEVTENVDDTIGQGTPPGSGMWRRLEDASIEPLFAGKDSSGDWRNPGSRSRDGILGTASRTPNNKGSSHIPKADTSSGLVQGRSGHEQADSWGTGRGHQAVNKRRPASKPPLYKVRDGGKSPVAAAWMPRDKELLSPEMKVDTNLHGSNGGDFSSGQPEKSDDRQDTMLLPVGGMEGSDVGKHGSGRGRGEASYRQRREYVPKKPSAA